MLAMASMNILEPAKITPKNPRNEARTVGRDIVSTAIIANSTGIVITAAISFTWSGLSLIFDDTTNSASSPRIVEIIDSASILKSGSDIQTFLNSIKPSSNLTANIPGTARSASLSPFRFVPRFFAASPGVTPIAWTQSILGLCPRLSKTEHDLEILPLEISSDILAVPSVTDILQDLIPGSLLTAFVAFMAQSAQSIPLMFQSNS